MMLFNKPRHPMIRLAYIIWAVSLVFCLAGSALNSFTEDVLAPSVVLGMGLGLWVAGCIALWASKSVYATYAIPPKNNHAR